MSARASRWPAIAASVGCLAALLAIGAGTPRAAPKRPAAKQSTCFWLGPFTSLRGPKYNYAFPDSGAIYWTARYSIPPGATLRLHGRFAHARYESLTSYAAGAQGPVDGLRDVSTAPDKGSSNPFKPGADRAASRRSFTVTVSGDPPPTDPRLRAGNTVYAGVAGQPDQELIYRVYLPDKGLDYTGGVGLPVPELTLADGRVLRGAGLCAELGSSDNTLESSQLALDVYRSLRDQPGKPPTFPAMNPPRFGAFYNTAYTIRCVYLGTCDPHPARTGGQYSNPDNNYVGAFLNRRFGHVLVLTGTLPTIPRTVAGNRRMGSGQLRYWSICQNESFATTRGAGCLYDEQVPIDRHRRFVIVTSRRADRPRNAVRRCGVGFIPWPRQGDGAGHPDDALLLIRNMLPSAGFHHAVQDTKVPGDERSVMGPYLPRARYMSKKAFELRGC